MNMQIEAQYHEGKKKIAFDGLLTFCFFETWKNGKLSTCFKQSRTETDDMTHKSVWINSNQTTLTEVRHFNIDGPWQVVFVILYYNMQKFHVPTFQPVNYIFLSLSLFPLTFSI